MHSCNPLNTVLSFPTTLPYKNNLFEQPTAEMEAAASAVSLLWVTGWVRIKSARVFLLDLHSGRDKNSRMDPQYRGSAAADVGWLRIRSRGGGEWSSVATGDHCICRVCINRFNRVLSSYRPFGRPLDHRDQCRINTGRGWILECQRNYYYRIVATVDGIWRRKRETDRRWISDSMVG